MPLKKKGKDAVGENIKELTEANKSKPPGKKRSRKQILAISLSAAGKSKDKAKKKTTKKK